MRALQVVVIVLLLICFVSIVWYSNHGGGGGPPPSSGGGGPPPSNPSGCYTVVQPSTTCPNDIPGLTIKSTLGCCAAEASANDPRYAPTSNPKHSTFTFTVQPKDLFNFGGSGNWEENKTKRTFYINVPEGVAANTKLPFVLLFDSGATSGNWDYNMSHGDNVPKGLQYVLQTVANEYPVVTMGPAAGDHWYNVDKTTTSRRGDTFTWTAAPKVANSWNVGLYNGLGISQDMPYIRYVVSKAMSNPKYHCSNKCVVVAFSAGTAMASRVMQEFPAMPVGTSVPTIIGAVLNDGASYQCYAYDPGTLVVDTPTPFAPCSSSQGCCPNGFTEERYIHDGTNHPPTLVQSPTGEPFADPDAAAKYFEALSAVQGKVMQLNPTFDSHGLDPRAAPIETKFILDLLDQARV